MNSLDKLYQVNVGRILVLFENVICSASVIFDGSCWIKFNFN